MAEKPTHQVSAILQAISAGEERATDELIPLVYGELRRIANVLMAGERPGQTLQPTALVHEAYVRLLGREKPLWNDRAHFFNAAAQAMRRILVDRARSKARLKRGGDLDRVTLGEGADVWEPRPEELIDLDAALDRLEEIDSELAQVVGLRYFAGLTVEETARALDISPRSVNRSWTAARAFLHSELTTKPEWGPPSGA